MAQRIGKCVDCADSFPVAGARGRVPRWCAECKRRHVNGLANRYRSERRSIETCVQWGCHNLLLVNWAKRSYCDRCQSDSAVGERRWNAMHRHGLTPEAHASLLADQGGVCAICGTADPGGHGTWHIDHDHECCPTRRSCGGCIRGLLCARCNVGIGMLKDSPQILRAAADYLEMRE